MARVAYVMNETMGRVGLSGKAFLPMLLGFGQSPAYGSSEAVRYIGNISGHAEIQHKPQDDAAYAAGLWLYGAGGDGYQGPGQ